MIKTTSHYFLLWSKFKNNHVVIAGGTNYHAVFNAILRQANLYHNGSISDYYITFG